MNRTTTLAAAGGVLLLAGIAAFILSKRDPEPSGAEKSRSRNAAAQEVPAAGGGQPPAGEGGARAGRARNGVKFPELATQYGESRTNLSKHVTENVVSLLEDTIEMGEMATSGQFAGAFGGQDGALRMGLGRLGNDLKLTDEQREKARAMFGEFQKRQLAQSKEAVERLKKDPTALMQLMLASDARARGEIDDAEYKRLQTGAGEDLGGVLSPLDERNFRGGRPLRDEAFVSEFKAILDPEQQQTLQASLDQQATGNTGENAIPDGNIANLPSMELEKLDTTIQSVKKLTTGFKSLMEGFGGLQDLGPLMEQQRRQREGQPAAAPPSE